MKEEKLSSLPKNVIDTILINLSIRDAVRTSILSRAWRYEWTNMSQIVFETCNYHPLTKKSRQGFEQKIVNIVDQVLLLHQGSIDKFKFSVDIESSEHINRWILYVSEKGIREFTLDVFKGPIYILHSCLFSCQGITHLELYRCSIVPPASFNGFSNLTTLDLQLVSFLNNGLENLISNCPLLKKLRLAHITGCTHLKLCAPNLVVLELESRFEDICFERTPVLAKASIKLYHDEGYKIPPNGGVCKLVDLLGCLPGIRRLELLGQSYQILSSGDVPVRLPNECSLSYFSANINFGDMEDMLLALCILRGSSSLHEIYIESILGVGSEQSSVEDFWKAKESFNCSFRQLQILKVVEYTGTNAELRFIEFVLANAPVLEKVKIKLKEDTSDGMKILKKLLKLCRISSKAKVFVL